MNRDKRRAGRAIRKQRRHQRELIAAVSAINFDGLGEAMVEAASQIGRAFVDAVDATRRSFESFTSAYTEAVEREHRMTHRALTTGKGDA